MLRGLVLSAFLLAAPAAAAGPRGLGVEPELHPLDGFTAETLRAGEVFYAQSPATLPLPSWAFIGVTDWLTVEVDLLPLLGGFFVEPHLPVPSVDLRFRLLEKRGFRPGVALETMVQYLYGTNVQEHSPNLVVTREALSWFARVNVSQPLGRGFTAHGSFGFTLAESIKIENRDRMTYHGRHHRWTASPDASIALGWHASRRLALFATASYGTTFTFLDNVPRKLQATYGLRVAPFVASRYSILRTLRVELAAIHMYFPDARESMSLPLPIWPYFYWQWGG